MWKFRANRKQWDIAIADHTGPGQLPRLMLSPFGSPTPCGLHRCFLLSTEKFYEQAMMSMLCP